MFRNCGFRDTSQYFCLYESPETDRVSQTISTSPSLLQHRIFILNRSSTKISKRYLSCVQTQRKWKFSLMFDFFFAFAPAFSWCEWTQTEDPAGDEVLSPYLLTKRVTLQYFFHLCYCISYRLPDCVFELRIFLPEVYFMKIFRLQLIKNHFNKSNLQRWSKLTITSEREEFRNNF